MPRGFVQSFVAGAVACVLAACVAAACAPADPIVLPASEFLVATADSTFWVRTGAEGVRVRGVPMTLAMFDGRYRELYVASVDRSYSDAVFVGERVYMRDLIRGDSSVVLEDTLILSMADHYAHVTPDARPLSPDDEDPEDPVMTAYGETDILGVRGPYVLVEHRSSISNIDDGGDDDTTRAAIDLRTARTVPFSVALRELSARDADLAAPLPRVWRRSGFDLLVHDDTVAGSIALSVRTSLHGTRPLLHVSGTPRVYWLDQPAIDTATRRALQHAFNAAAAYDEAVRFVRNESRPSRTRPHPISLPVSSPAAPPAALPFHPVAKFRRV